MACLHCRFLLEQACSQTVSIMSGRWPCSSKSLLHLRQQHSASTCGSDQLQQTPSIATSAVENGGRVDPVLGVHRHHGPGGTKVRSIVKRMNASFLNLGDGSRSPLQLKNITVYHRPAFHDQEAYPGSPPGSKCAAILGIALHICRS